MGGQPLYGLTMAARSRGGSVDSESETFGIRTITTRLVGASPLAPDGSRQFLVNGRPFVFRGGGWSEDLFLRYSPANTAQQIALIKSLGLNGIRTEGKQMPANFYEQMDRAGILIDAGYQCCDAWQLQGSKLTSAHDYRILALSARTIGENLRNHPSVAQFQLERQPADAAPGAGVGARVPCRGLPGAADRLRRIQDRPRPRALGREGGPLRLGAAQLLVRHQPLRPR